MKLLIYCPSPRDIEEVENSWKEINHDKFIVKYVPYSHETNPYEMARQYFLKHKEYSHMAISPDDLVLTKEGVEKLWQDAKLYDAISGTCNWLMGDYNRGEGRVACTKNLPSMDREGRLYEAYTLQEMKGDIIQVGWSGNPCMILSRKILTKMPFYGDTPDKSSYPQSFDVGIAWGLKKLGIPNMVDTSVYFKHLKGANDPLMIGKKPMQIWIVKNGKTRIEMIDEPKEIPIQKPIINPLLCCPSPRDIIEVYDALRDTGYDRLYAKYFPEKTAYNMLRDYFINHKQYTHLVICPDDLIITKFDVDQLIHDLEDFDYPILSGVCNVDNGANKDSLNITENLPHPTRQVPERNQVGWRFYSWVNRNTKFEKPIMPFLFSGFACMFLRRDVVDRYVFIDDSRANGTPDLITGAIDVMFANTCAIEQVPQMVDTRVRMEHLKGKERFFDIILGDGELRLYPAHKDHFFLLFKEEPNKQREWKLTGGEVVEGIIEPDKCLNV